MNSKYLVIYEKVGRSFGAVVPDFQGASRPRSLLVVRKRIREALAMHIDDMIDRGERLPEPADESEYVSAA